MLDGIVSDRMLGLKEEPGGDRLSVSFLISRTLIVLLGRDKGKFRSLTSVNIKGQGQTFRLITIKTPSLSTISSLN